MKIFTIIFIIICCSVLFYACGEDDAMNPDGDAPTLNYDGDQESAPNLDAATYVAAARFTAAQIGDFADDEISAVQYYVAHMPENCKVKIYGAQTATMPGALLYEADVTSSTTEGEWNTHQLSQAVALSSNDIWIGIEFRHSARQATIGCDPGPAVTDGDWLYSSLDDTWTPLSQRTAISINWNIRGVLRIK